MGSDATSRVARETSVSRLSRASSLRSEGDLKERVLPMLLRSKFLPLFTILLAIPSPAFRGLLFAQDDASWKDRFLKEAPSEWEKYRARAKRFQGVIERTTVRLTPEKEVMNKDRCEIKQKDGCALFLVQALVSEKQPDEKGLGLCINNQYGFEIRRRTPNTQWVAVNLDVDLSDGMKFNLASPPTEAVVYWTDCPVDFNLIPYFSWSGIKDPKFTVQQVTPISRSGRQGVKVEFAYRSPREKPNMPSVKKGYVLYDPQRFWIILEYNAQIEWESTNVKASTTVAYEYEETADGFPIAKRIIRRFTPVKGVDRENHYEFNLKEADVPESDFTLTAFGLPEPSGIKRGRPFPWYLALAGIGTACLGVFFFLRSRAKRARG